MPDADVIVVGAGFAGLSAAASLHAAGVSVLVLEARDRVGGRAEARTNALGERVDTGGQFVNDEMPLLLGLIRSQGLPLVEPGRSARLRTFPSPARFDSGTDDPGAAVFDAVEALYRGQLLHADPASTPGSAADWIHGATEDPATRAMTLSLVAVANCCDPASLPAAMLADTLNRGPHEAEELQYFTPHTMQGLAETLAAPVADRIRFGAAVTRVDWSDGGVAVTANGNRLTARRVILCVSPVQLQDMAFHPPLPGHVAAAMHAFGRMEVVKILIRYETAFWAARGWSGSMASTDPPGLFLGDTSAPGRPMLVGFLGGPFCAAFRAMPPEDRRALVLSRAADAFGPEALAPLDYTERDWGADTLSPGGYGVLVTGERPAEAPAVLRAHAGTVAFAVSDISDRFPGYIEGAIHMGRSAAERCSAALRAITA